MAESVDKQKRNNIAGIHKGKKNRANRHMESIGSPTRDYKDSF